jgi:uncharacterized membrane protein
VGPQEEKKMSEKAEIIALGLKDPEEADHVLSKLYMLPREYLAGEEGVVFLEPLVGFAVGSALGASTGALAGFLTDYGIDDDSSSRLLKPSPTIRPGFSFFSIKLSRRRSWLNFQA